MHNRISANELREVQKGAKQNFNAKNKQIYIIEFDMEIEELLGMAKHAFKILLRQKLGVKTFMLWVPDKEASINTMRRYKQILATHLAMTECVSSIELAGIMDLNVESDVRFTNHEGKTAIKRCRSDQFSWTSKSQEPKSPYSS